MINFVNVCKYFQDEKAIFKSYLERDLETDLLQVPVSPLAFAVLCQFTPAANIFLGFYFIFPLSAYTLLIKLIKSHMGPFLCPSPEISQCNAH